LADTLFFGPGEDDTDLALGKYYLTNKNLPWAINLSESFDYPAAGF
jgi:LruC domain-containing protein